MTAGLYLLHKPAGETSFATLEKFRAAHLEAGTRACHGGALDPFATGLLLALAGPATRVFDCLHDAPKVYEATIAWGVETDTGDALGKPIAHAEETTTLSLTPSRIADAIAPFLGWCEQVPPATSNKRLGGERAYVRAHRGESFELPAARVFLHEAVWTEHDLPQISRVRLVTRGGYYVRSLARDLGRALGCPAHLASLRRADIGPWRDPGPGQFVAIHGVDMLPWLPTRILSDNDVGRLRAKESIHLGELSPGGWKFPPGFPEPIGPVLAIHRGNLAFLVRRDGEELRWVASLRGA